MGSSGLAYYELDQRGIAFFWTRLEALLGWNPPQPLASAVHEAIESGSYTAFAVAPIDLAFDHYQFDVGISAEVISVTSLWTPVIDLLLANDSSLAYLLNESKRSTNEPSSLVKDYGKSYKECLDAIFYMCASQLDLDHVNTCFRDSYSYGHLSVLARVQDFDWKSIANRVDISFNELSAMVQFPEAIVVDAYDTDGIVILTADRSILDKLVDH